MAVSGDAKAGLSLPEMCGRYRMNQYQLTITEPLQRNRGLAPLRPLTPLQRIGYLDEVSEVRCIQSFADYQTGQWYKVLTSLVQVIRWDSRQTLAEQTEHMELTGQELAVLVVDANNQPRCFMDRRFVSDQIVISEGIKPEFGFDQLADCFDIPSIPHVAELYPQKFAKYMQRLRSLERLMRCENLKNRDFRFTDYQMEDLATAAIRDGFVLAFQTGLGKCLALIAWALIKTGIEIVNRRIQPTVPILFVTLGDLKSQVAKEALEKFGIECFICTGPTDSPSPGLYLASYETVAKYAFSDQFQCVLVDEATKIKQGSTAISEAVRRLNPPYRCVATATPVKNRVQDLFWLLQWAAGGNSNSHRGFPFDGNARGLKKFETLYLVRERKLKHRSFHRKPSAEVCNLHSLWKITSALIVRRRKQDVKGMVKKIESTVMVELGTQQAAIYRQISDSEQSTGQKLMALRQAACCPAVDGITPKLLVVLKAILVCMSKREQVIVFSAFNAMSDQIAHYLRLAHIESILLDGRTSQGKRALMAQRFKEGHPFVMLAGEGSMSYGHSFSTVHNVIVTSEDWAMDLMSQAPDRAHRLDSKRDVNVTRVLCRNTVEQRVHDLHDDKNSAAQMVLDAEVPDEIKPSEVLALPDMPTETVDEQVLAREWNELVKGMYERRSVV